MSRFAVSVLVSLVLLGCGSEGTPASADRFDHETSGSYRIDATGEREARAALQGLADQCAAAGCIKRETATCLFARAREDAGRSAVPVGAAVTSRYGSGEHQLLGWFLWSDLPLWERTEVAEQFVCVLDGRTGEVAWCGTRGRDMQLLPELY